MNHVKKLLYVTAAASLVSGSLSYAQKAPVRITPADYAGSTEWPTYGHDSGGMRFSPLKQITPDNVGALEIAWVYHMKPEGYVPPARGNRGGRAGGAAGAQGRGGAPGGRGGEATGFNGSEGTPLIVGGLMYVSSPYGRVVALNADDGTRKSGLTNCPAAIRPRAASSTSPATRRRRRCIVVGTSDSKLLTLDAKTGALNTKFGDSGVVHAGTSLRTSSIALFTRT